MKYNKERRCVMKKSILTTRGQRGQGMTEYVIILVAIAVVCIAIAVQFGGKIKGLFETADSEIDTVDSGL
tara:strand:- start:827 stop:1036 length:210 start_codon:yes stop_codon:yes gene_type:complete